jgi:hypothetical protein
MHLDTEEGHNKTRRTPVLPWLDPEVSETLYPAHCVRSLVDSCILILKKATTKLTERLCCQGLKSGGQGMSVSGRVDHGGRRVIGER